MRFLDKRMKKLSELFNSIIEKPLLTSSLVLLIVTIIVLSLSLHYYLRDFDSFIQQVLAEAHGMIFDIAVIGILHLLAQQERRDRGSAYVLIKMK